MTLEEKLQWIYDRHDIGVNQKYDDNLPYSFHLKMVVAVVRRFIYLYHEQIHSYLLIAGAGHDLIEDARMTYNDVKKMFGQDVADMVFACTDEKGKNRTERHSEKFFNDLKELRPAVFIKLCDMIANITYSRVMGSGMFKKYQKEFGEVKSKLYIQGEFEPLWEELEIILK